MTASAIVTIWCDHPGCGQWADTGGASTAAESRRRLRRSSWTLAVRNPNGGPALDYCPRHRPNR